MNPYKNSYKIGDGTGGQFDHYLSQYKNDHGPQPLESAEAKRKSAMDQVTSILFGTSKDGPGISEHADK